MQQLMNNLAWVMATRYMDWLEAEKLFQSKCPHNDTVAELQVVAPRDLLTNEVGLELSGTLRRSCKRCRAVVESRLILNVTRYIELPSDPPMCLSMGDALRIDGSQLDLIP
jgi:hypothetical protein